MNHHHRLLAALLFAAVSGPATLSTLSADNPGKTILLSEEHLAAARRDRRIIINFDTISGDRSFGGRDPAELVKWKFHVIDTEGVQIDSVWWDWGEGHQSPWPSEIMPLYDAEGYRKWVRQGIDIAAIFAKESKRRGIEAFYNYRINGSDNDLGPFRKIPLKLEHPEWLIHTWPGPVGYWNFAVPEVRQYKLSILREIAERYDYDGIALDFARVTPVLPPGQAWSERDKLTEFIRDFRQITLEVSRKRGRPFLVGVRLPENLPGCHFDGLDIETWVRDGLVDVLALGVRSFDVDLLAFRRLTEGTHVKLYPCIDDHHASDGYATPPIEIYRGMAANWWQQGADGINTFNFNHAPDFPYRGAWETHLAAYRQIGSPETLRRKNKIFVVQRRGGGHGPSVTPNAEDWSTPRWNYFNTNMFAPLPAPLANDGRGDTLLMISVGDDVSAEADHLDNISLHLLLSDPAAEITSPDERLEPVLVATIGHEGGLTNTPPARGIEKTIEVRLNNIKLDTAHPEGGWLVFQHLPSDLFAVGENLVGVRVSSRHPDMQHAISIEKLEVHVNYH